jgi:hypothetical protein
LGECAFSDFGTLAAGATAAFFSAFGGLLALCLLLTVSDLAALVLPAELLPSFLVFSG